MMRLVGVREPQEPALLDCENAPSCGRWVTHDFVGLRRVETADATGQPSHGDEEVYRCRCCGRERRWGLLAPSSRYRGVERPRTDLPRLDPEGAAA